MTCRGVVGSSPISSTDKLAGLRVGRLRFAPVTHLPSPMDLRNWQTHQVTPAVDQLVAAQVPHEIVTYEQRAEGGYGLEAATALGIDPEQVFKTLVAETNNGELVVAIVPVSGHLDLKGLAKAAGAKKVAMADVAKAERSSGYVAGGISPFGHRKSLRTFLDETALVFDAISVSGGRRGMEITLAPQALVDVLRATVAPIAS